MASCVRNIRTKNYQNLIIGFQVTVENVWDVFLRQCSISLRPPFFSGLSSACGLDTQCCSVAQRCRVAARYNDAHDASP